MTTDSRSTDRGMTLIELLVTIAVMGAIATVLSAAITVTFRQQADTSGSVEVARWEQTLALYLPPDLASADPTLASSDPAARPTVSGAPCATPACTFGSNALLVGFDDGSGLTSISYRYGPSDNGEGFMLTRVVCHAGSCRSRVVLRDLAAPSNPAWAPGDPVPPSVINVALPDATTCDYCSITVNVTVNGLPTLDGVPRSSTVRVTAGGVTQPPLSTPAFEGPEFIQARSGCGGPVTLVVDESGSIGGAVDSVRRGVESFVRAFEGTPTRLQVITMNGSTDVLDSIGSSAWNRFFDLSEPADVNELVGDPTPGVGGYLNQIGASGQTNWEAALYRTFYHDSGVPYTNLGNPSIPAPTLVVFFTDGVPTRPNGADPSFGDYDVPDADGFSARAWWRANEIIIDFRSEARLIGVGVGDAFSTDPNENRRNTSSLPDPWPNSIKNVVFLGDLIAGNSTPIAWNGVTEQFETVQSTDGTWGDVSTADVLGTSDMNNLGGALAAIALDSCGGTLTVQTREGGNPADIDVTYTLGVEQATTNRINRAVAFDVPLAGNASATVELRPESLDGSGYVATGWSCRAGGANLVQGTDYTLVGAPGDGIDVTVSTNTAVSCTMQIAPS